MCRCLLILVGGCAVIGQKYDQDDARMIPDWNLGGTRMIPGGRKISKDNKLVVAAMDFTSKADSYFPIGRRFSILVRE